MTSTQPTHNDDVLPPLIASNRVTNYIATRNDTTLYTLQFLTIGFIIPVFFFTIYAGYSLYTALTTTTTPVNITTTLFNTFPATTANAFIIILAAPSLIHTLRPLIFIPCTATRKSPLTALTRREKLTLATLTTLIIASFTATYIATYTRPDLLTETFYITLILTTTLLLDLTHRPLTPDADRT